mmetsp:Transcript_119845/g.187983  ORF Transcript_119845/g.187983 Transcript_119845/m.187983 type:complete len:142 (-) Transcript_119845:54-479(-)
MNGLFKMGLDVSQQTECISIANRDGIRLWQCTNGRCRILNLSGPEHVSTFACGKCKRPSPNPRAPTVTALFSKITFGYSNDLPFMCFPWDKQAIAQLYKKYQKGGRKAANQVRKELQEMGALDYIREAGYASVDEAIADLQ